MTPTRTTVVIVAAVFAAAAALTWVIAHPARRPVTAAAPAVAAVPAATAGTSVPASAPPSAATTTTASASVGSTAAPTATAPTAQPFIQSFADQPGVPPLKPLPSPTRTISVAANIDGCDHAYGLPTQCIPWTFPAGTTDKCAWLAAHGYLKLKVVAADRQKLDPDGDKIACDNQ